MKMHISAILKSGTAKDVTKAARDNIFAGHIKNINRLAEEGKLMTAGPLEDNPQSDRGNYSFNAATLEEGKKLVATDLLYWLRCLTLICICGRAPPL